MTAGALALSDQEAVAIGEITDAFVAALPADRRDPFDRLAQAATAGAVPTGLIGELERVCVLALETGRARRLGRAETERLVNAVYRRTPGGTALASDAAGVNKVMAALTGRTLQTARLTATMPGRYQLDLVVDGIDVAIALDPEGPQVRSLQTG